MLTPDQTTTNKLNALNKHISQEIKKIELLSMCVGGKVRILENKAILVIDESIDKAGNWKTNLH